MKDVIPGELITADLFNGLSGEIRTVREDIDKFLKAMTIDTNFNVGIGKQPESGIKLDVAGQVNATFFKGDGSLLTNLEASKIINGPLAASLIPTLNYAPTGHTHTAQEVNALSLNGGTITGDLKVNGNVGIGTTTPPSEKLEVNGNLKISAGEIIQDPWIPVDKQIGNRYYNNWEAYSDGFSEPGYFRDKNGIVHLRGLIKSGDAKFNDTGANSTGLIFILKDKYRPKFTEVHPAYSNDMLGRCDISPEGYVMAIFGNNGYFSLDGITFRAYQ
jgi:hypothetical protein